jgi:Mg-chelatase subunit ChlD
VSADPRLQRWRLVLGRFSDSALQSPLDGDGQKLDAVLDYLYAREYRGRGIRSRGKEERRGSLDPSQLTVPTWLHHVRELFPRETAEVIQRHALDRYKMTELVTDEKVLEKLEPNFDLLKTVLTFRGLMKGRVLDVARSVIRKVVEEIRRKIENDIRRTLWGRLNRFQHSPLKIAQNLDWRGTIRRNLKNWDPERRKLIVQNVRFFSRVERRLPWDVIVCVDQSGSMVNSVIYSAVMAGILAGLPSLRVKLVVFDTNVVDLSEYVDDPVEVLMSVQLGGGTDIGKALRYCEQLVTTPRRTALILISDFMEGASPNVMLSTVKRMAEARVRMIGLAALDEEAAGIYDVAMAERLADRGMEIAALTPSKLAEWLAKVMS